ncbi:MAG: CDC27 family protein [Campylobacterota bacterium]|nr:CDC27 family protein [Campylobacterota bacterium]
MYDMKELEQKWLKYKIKQSIPWALFLLLIVLAFIYYNNRVVVNQIVLEYYTKVSKHYISKPDEKNITKPESNQEIQAVVIKSEKNSTIKVVEINVSDEVFDTNATLYEENTTNPFFSSIKDKSEVEKKSPEARLEEEIERRHEKKYIHIKKSSNAYKEVEKRFASSQDPEDALFLARYYYENKKYKKAEEWAFIANELNDESEESWLIYAKAKAARGEYLKAIHILDAYLKKTNSLRARKLLEEYKEKLSKK